ncbi:hypothetical protein FSP39_011294 [Pinctada imbricata]|uniref:G-protein coupled receptors family 1 profile domain-containing protein n=1 Tax=Pinctada imbricata TaxID=66713 RepID=A0AA88Y8Q1_PINIB|nr:hypothetical protein FSP39_011294 [Pinctada imbricata]
MDTTSDLATMMSTTAGGLGDSNGFNILERIYSTYIPQVYLIPKVLKTTMYVIGFPGNLLACILWLQKPFLHSSGCYLAALAISDLLFLVLSLVHDLENLWKVNVLNNGILCKGFPSLFLLFQYLSPLLTLAFTVERFISIRFPLERRVYCNIRRAVVVIISLTFLSLCVSAVQVHIWEYNLEATSCLVKEDIVWLWTPWTWATECTMFMFVPIVILIFNVIVIRTLKNAKRRARSLYGNGPPKHRTATTKMLLIVSFFFIFTTLPVSIVYSLLDNFLPGDLNVNIAEDTRWQRHFRFAVIREVIYDLGISHYVCNFYIYLLTGKRFRQGIKRCIYRFSKRDSMDRSSRSLRSSFTELRSM